MNFYSLLKDLASEPIKFYNTENKKGKVLHYSILVLGWVKVIFLYPAGIPFEDSALDEMMEVDG